MDKFDKLKTLLKDEIAIIGGGWTDLVELEYQDRGSDLAVLSGDGYVIKILRDGTWELDN